LKLRFGTKGQLALDVLQDAYADGLSFDFACEDEVYGSCMELREFLEDRGQAHLLHVASSFTLTFAFGTMMTCANRPSGRSAAGGRITAPGRGCAGNPSAIVVRLLPRICRPGGIWAGTPVCLRGLPRAGPSLLSSAVSFLAGLPSGR
jgi:hypothetical protein